MRIALISDAHLGYARFEDDAYKQFEEAIVKANEMDCDIILFGGDLFDSKIPKLETLKRAIEILKKSEIKIVAIHGNHERRAVDSTNTLKLLESAGIITYIHNKEYIFEKNGERIKIIGIGSVPEEYSSMAIRKATERFDLDKNEFNILMIHQTIKELIPGKAEGNISRAEIEEMKFDLVFNGHIHKKTIMLDGKLLMPGSTVLTQLKKNETEKKGFFIYDTRIKKEKFVSVDSREFAYVEIEFENGDIQEIKDKVITNIKKIKKENEESIIAIKLKGNLKHGLRPSDLVFPFVSDYRYVFIDNQLNSNNLKINIEKIKNMKEDRGNSVKEIAMKELKESTEKEITMFDTRKLFDKLVENSDDAFDYLMEIMEETGD